MLMSNGTLLGFVFAAAGVGLVIAAVIGAKLEDWLQARDERQARAREGT